MRRRIGIAQHARIVDNTDIERPGVMGLYLYLKKELPEAEVDVYLEKPAEIFDCISHF